MNDIEATIILLLLFMSVPDFCRKLGRPALGYSVYVIVGILLAPLVSQGVHTMLSQAGQVGFLLLLFEVGLDIALPRFREVLPVVRFVAPWLAWQYPVVVALAILSGLPMGAALLATAALTGCSVGMAHAAWKQHRHPDAQTGKFVLQVMVILELLSILLISLGTVVLEKGLSVQVWLRLAGIILTILLVARFSGRLIRLFQWVLARATHWRMHLLVLLVLVVCALGERLGLASAKTAFVMGLFMSRIEHEGKGLEEYMAPVSQRFLIPIFFVSLGFLVDWGALGSWSMLLAFGSAGLLLGWREWLHRHWVRTGGDNVVPLLLSPNLTIVSLAASVLIHHAGSPDVAAWLILTGLFLTVGATLLLPGGNHLGNPARMAPRPAPQAPCTRPPRRRDWTVRLDG